MRFHPDHLPETKHLFFTGKGGVGKTSIAAASAVTLADNGKQVLLVSTDPASNLQDVFDTELSNEQTAIPSIHGLHALNINPEEAAAAYREKVVGPYRGKLPDAAIRSMEEQLSGACTVEIAAFDEFTTLLRDTKSNQAFDYIVFDTAPTGHTLRLLQLPTAWSDFLETSTHGASCLGPMSGLKDKEELYNQTTATLADEEQTSLFLVTRPEDTSMYEANRASAELHDLGIKNQYLVINGIHPLDSSEDSVAAEFIHNQKQALHELPNALHSLPQYQVPLFAENMEGENGLRAFFQNESVQEKTAASAPPPDLPGTEAIVEEVIKNDTRLIMTMGKGGVGKTTTAASLALELAGKGHSVHLTTTDPANHLSLALTGQSIPASMTISQLDPKAETKAYKQSVLARVSADLDEDSLAYIKEDLDSPCTEEIAVFHAFAKTAARAKEEFVVLDTAPTGHTLLLLDAAESYHQEVLRSTGDLPEEVKELLPRLRHSKETAVIVVSLPEATPVLEANRLEHDLNRAGIEPSWWLINHSFLATATTDPVLAGRAAHEADWIDEVTKHHPGRTSLVSYHSTNSV
ncbi:arsenical pump-driving ATPase [Salibacterium salarium]|nr:arsenical pump-driving ATPase [Salibacterium salarium]